MLNIFDRSDVNIETGVDYYTIDEKNVFKTKFNSMLREKRSASQPIVFLCIGTDMSIFDSLGPIVGSELNKHAKNRYVVRGTLDNLVHAKNLSDVIQSIYKEFDDPFIIAIDASFGHAMSDIGKFTLRSGPLAPGTGAGKDLPLVGDMHVTGVVAEYDKNRDLLCYTVRLGFIMKLACNVTDCLLASLNYYFR